MESGRRGVEKRKKLENEKERAGAMESMSVRIKVFFSTVPARL